jgi:hypothetical protein
MIPTFIPSHPKDAAHIVAHCRRELAKPNLEEEVRAFLEHNLLVSSRLFPLTNGEANA